MQTVVADKVKGEGSKTGSQIIVDLKMVMDDSK